MRQRLTSSFYQEPGCSFLLNIQSLLLLFFLLLSPLASSSSFAIDLADDSEISERVLRTLCRSHNLGHLQSLCRELREKNYSRNRWHCVTHPSGSEICIRLRGSTFQIRHPALRGQQGVGCSVADDGTFECGAHIFSWFGPNLRCSISGELDGAVCIDGCEIDGSDDFEILEREDKICLYRDSSDGPLEELYCIDRCEDLSRCRRIGERFLDIDTFYDSQAIAEFRFFHFFTPPDQCGSEHAEVRVLETIVPEEGKLDEHSGYARSELTRRPMLTWDSYSDASSSQKQSFLSSRVNLSWGREMLWASISVLSERAWFKVPDNLESDSATNMCLIEPGREINCSYKYTAPLTVRASNQLTAQVPLDCYRTDENHDAELVAEFPDAISITVEGIEECSLDEE